MPKKLKNKINWPALNTVLFNVVPDSTFNIGSGITTITPNLASLLWGMSADSYEANRITYPEKTVVNPHMGLNTIIYNPNTNNRDAVSLDALHVMHDSPIYLGLYKQYVESLPQGFEPLMEAANDEFGDEGVTIIEKYLKGLPLSKEEQEAVEPIYDALLRRQFAPDYMRNVLHGYQDKATLPIIPNINMSGDEAIRRYMESYPLKEVTITPENKHEDGGSLYPDWEKLSMRDRAAYIRLAVSRGIHNIDDIIGEYNEFKKGGFKKPSADILKLNFLNYLELSLDGYSRYNTPGWRKLLTDLAFQESSYNADSLNSIGAKGYFQLMPFNRSLSWDSPILLFHEMYKLTDANIKELKNRMTKDDFKLALLKGIDIYGLIAGAHLGGVKNALTALRGGKNTKDSNGSSVLSYMKRFSLIPSRNLIESDNMYNAPIIMPNDNPRVVRFTNPYLQVDNPLDNQIPILIQELSLVLSLPIEKLNTVPKVIVASKPRREYIKYDPTELLDLLNSNTAPYEPIELSRPLTATERLALLNSARQSFLLKNLEDDIIRNQLLSNYDLNKLKKDVEDLRFYRNMATNEGNLYQKGGKKLPIGGPLIHEYPGDRVWTDLCALFSNDRLRKEWDSIIRGNAWNLDGVDIIFNGYDGLNRPETYELPLVKEYNHNATDNVFKNFDSKTLDTTQPYVVNMYYNNSPALEEAYNNGKGVTGTHTGLLTYDEPTLKWWVTHNIHGNIHLEPFINLLNSKGKYGVTAIYAPRKDTVWNRVKGFFGFADGGLMNKGHIYDGFTEPTNKMLIGLNVNGWPNYTIEQILANAEKVLAQRRAIEEAGARRANDYLTTSNDATSVNNGKTQNQHLAERAIEGAKAHAAWTKEHPVLTQWSNVLGTIPFVIASIPAIAAGGSGLAALGDAAAATSAGQAITAGLAPWATAATTSIKGAPLYAWGDAALSSMLGAHSAETAIEEGGVSPEVTLGLLPLYRPVSEATKLAVNTTKPYVNKAVESLQNNYPALFDPYTSWDATLGYHGNNIFDRVVGTVGRRYNFTPKAEVPEFHRRLRIYHPEDFRMTDDGRFIMSSGRTGEGHDNIVNFATSEAARSHRSHKSLSGIDDFILNPKAIEGVEFKSIQPSDTFFEIPELAVNPKDVTLVSGNPETLNYARSLGMKTLSSPKLRSLSENSMSKEEIINSRSTEGIGKFLFNVAQERDNSGIIGEEMQRLTSMRGAPTIQDYAHFENVTGLNSGVIPNTPFNIENAKEILGRLGNVRRTPTFNNVIYDPATSIEAIYRKAKMGLKPWSDYYTALERMPSARSYTGDLLNWSADNWLSKRVGGFDAEDIAKLAGHTPEYLAIEKAAKAEGTWLKNADGSNWQGFINSRGKVSKDPHVWVMQQSAAGKRWSDEILGTGMKSERALGFPTYDGELWLATNPKVPQTFMSELKEPDFHWGNVVNKIIHGYIPQYKMNIERALGLLKGRAFGVTIPRDTKTLYIDAAGRNWSRITPVGNNVYMTTRDYVKDFLGEENPAIRINNVSEWHLPFGINTDDLIIGKSTPRKIWEGNNGDFDPLISNGYKALGGLISKI